MFGNISLLPIFHPQSFLLVNHEAMRWSFDESNDKAFLMCANAGIADLVPSLLYFETYLRHYPFIELMRMYYLDCAVDDGCLSSSANTAGPNDIRELLRFDSLTMNLGINDFIPHTSPSDWIWHNCHQHYHSFEAFIHYDILDTDGNAVAEGHKASFCLEDSICVGVYPPRYRCSTGSQGISMNCGDLYGRHLDCQWIDITGLTSGNYVVRQIVNPNRYVPETDYGNNIAQCHITYTKEPPYTSQFQLHSCWLSGLNHQVLPTHLEL